MSIGFTENSGVKCYIIRVFTGDNKHSFRKTESEGNDLGKYMYVDYLCLFANKFCYISYEQ